MTSLKERLDELDLSRYYEAFVSEGFDTWDALLLITEKDLGELNVKLGHRRKLQRAIADAKGQRPPSFQHHSSTSTNEPIHSEGSDGETRNARTRTAASRTGPSSTKRKYRRHPKPDENAPERPPSAYVIFSNQTRDSLKGQELSFTEIAKLVGERWQQLSPEEREPFEREATSAKETYYARLAEYKKTPEYKHYQDYVAEFRARHPAQAAEGKRSKLETETSISTRSSSHDLTERPRRRFSGGGGDESSHRHPRSGSSPPLRMYPNPSNPSISSHPTSPATQSFGGQQSPIARGDNSPMSMSSTATNQQQSGPYMNIAGSLDRKSDRRTNLQQYPGNQMAYSLLRSESSSRMSSGDSPSLPPLVHEETTLSSEGSTYAGHAYQGAQLGQAEAPKPHPHRLLPAPVPTPGAIPSPLDTTRPSLPVPFPGSSQDPRHSSSLAVLLRAGELAREAENRSEETE
ncbi:MAG: hypothetical protein M1820_006721 [Bogoriella megaspora]|nr:MAG: hypothetical protein M1820_006721 [Bogoriella megaspora]